VEAITPDTRGATTIREQLNLHRAATSCGSCHIKFDPAGFALENFDVAGGWRDRYRVNGGTGDKVVGLGKNGHAFNYRLAQWVDSSAQMADGLGFANIHGFKELLNSKERDIARNLLNRLIVYATGAPVSFADRSEVEKILDGAASSHYGVRTLIKGLVVSELFRRR